MIRQPVVDGRFYEGTESGLKKQLSQLMLTKENPRPAKALVVPHAGYMYSGWVAGETYASATPAETYVILGPNHRGLGASLGIFSQGAWRTPLGLVPIDEDIAANLLNSTDSLQPDVSAHQYEHSLEVQVPFIQARTGSKASIVPICVMIGGRDARVRELGDALAAAISASEKSVCLVASTDLTHYRPQEVAKAQDEKAIDAILALDVAGLVEVVEREGISMCGVAPTAIALVAAKALGATRAEVIRYATSGDVTGDTSDVVGYVGVLID